MSDVISGLTKKWTFEDKLHVTGTPGGCDPPDHSDEYEKVFPSTNFKCHMIILRRQGKDRTSQWIGSVLNKSMFSEF